ncbi:MAG TPA: hypothetical protein VMU14_19460 [Acidimicrobiales bacterium]|nr:hypothetical protein [Acidimicrobiales bacterium]
MSGLTPQSVEWTRRALGELTAWASDLDGSGPPLRVPVGEDASGASYEEAWARAVQYAIGYLNLSRSLAMLLSAERDVPLTNITRELGQWLASREAALQHGGPAAFD